MDLTTIFKRPADTVSIPRNVLAQIVEPFFKFKGFRPGVKTIAEGYEDTARHLCAAYARERYRGTMCDNLDLALRSIARTLNAAPNDQNMIPILRTDIEALKEGRGQLKTHLPSSTIGRDKMKQVGENLDAFFADPRAQRALRRWYDTFLPRP